MVEFEARDIIVIAIVVLVGVFGLFGVLSGEDISKILLAILGYVFGRGEAIALAKLKQR